MDWTSITTSFVAGIGGAGIIMILVEVIPRLRRKEEPKVDMKGPEDEGVKLPTLPFRLRPPKDDGMPNEGKVTMAINDIVADAIRSGEVDIEFKVDGVKLDVLGKKGTMDVKIATKKFVKKQKPPVEAKLPIYPGDEEI